MSVNGYLDLNLLGGLPRRWSTRRRGGGERRRGELSRRRELSFLNRKHEHCEASDSVAVFF